MAVTELLRETRPAHLPAFEVRFETPPGAPAQVDFAHFQVVFAGEPWEAFFPAPLARRNGM